MRQIDFCVEGKLRPKNLLIFETKLRPLVAGLSI
jgi:hypothetical protein